MGFKDLEVRMVALRSVPRSNVADLSCAGHIGTQVIRQVGLGSGAGHPCGVVVVCLLAGIRDGRYGGLGGRACAFFSIDVTTSARRCPS